MTNEAIFRPKNQRKSHFIKQIQKVAPPHERSHFLGVLSPKANDINTFRPNERSRFRGVLNLASAIENVRLDEDLPAARKLQAILLPSDPPEVEGLEIAVGLKPAREISVDLFDFFDYDSGQVAIVFGDSSVLWPAASEARPTCSASSTRAWPSARPRRSTRRSWLCSGTPARSWDARTQRLTMANAGGTPPIICRGEELLKPDTSGVPVGLLDDRRYDETVVQLQPFLDHASKGSPDPQAPRAIKAPHDFAAAAVSRQERRHHPPRRPPAIHSLSASPDSVAASRIPTHPAAP